MIIEVVLHAHEEFRRNVERAIQRAADRIKDMKYSGEDRRARRSFFRFHDGRVVTVEGDHPNSKVIYDGPERRVQRQYGYEYWPKGWPESLFGIGVVKETEIPDEPHTLDREEN